MFVRLLTSEFMAKTVFNYNIHLLCNSPRNTEAGMFASRRFTLVIYLAI